MWGFLCYSINRVKPFVKDRDEHSGTGTDKGHSGRQIQTHTMGRLPRRRHEEREAEYPDLGLVNLLEGKVLWFLFLLHHQCIAGTQRLLLLYLKWLRKDRVTRQGRSGKCLLLIPQHSFLSFWKPLPTNHVTFFCPVYARAQNSFHFVSYCDSSHNPSI